MKTINLIAVIQGKRYNTQTAVLLAGNDYWDGSNYERHGRNTFLYKTPKGNFFLLHRTCWQGEHDHIAPIEQSEAIDMWESLREQRVDFAEAFPGAVIEEA